jgi:hypothetical protein
MDVAAECLVESLADGGFDLALHDGGVGSLGHRGDLGFLEGLRGLGFLLGLLLRLDGRVGGCLFGFRSDSRIGSDAGARIHPDALGVLGDSLAAGGGVDRGWPAAGAR